MLYGVAANSVFINPDLVAGRWLEPPTRQNRYDIVLSDELLENEPDIQVGSIITLKHRGEKQDWHVLGIVDTAPILGPGGAAYTYYDSVTRFMKASEVVTSLLIRTEQRTPDFQKEVAESIAQAFDQRDNKIVAMETNSGLIENILSAFDIIVVLLLVTAVMIAVVGGLGLTGTMSLSVLERTREVGVMRSVGASTGTLRFMFILEGTIVGIISYIITLILSAPVTFAFGTALGETLRGKPLTFKFAFDGPIIWFMIVIVVSAVASTLPAHRASQISIREALTYE
jgi:putative ABC transport system permease protein